MQFEFFRKVLMFFSAHTLLIALTIFFKSTLAYAADWQCFTEPLTTSFISEGQGKTIELTVLHHNGVHYMPIHSGIITPYDLDYLKDQGSVLTKLGSRFSLTFNKEKCKEYGDWKLSCFTNEKKTAGNLTIDSAHLITSIVTQEIFDYTFREVEIHLSLRIQGKSYSIPMKYAANQCQTRYN